MLRAATQMAPILDRLRQTVCGPDPHAKSLSRGHGTPSCLSFAEENRGGGTDRMRPSLSSASAKGPRRARVDRRCSGRTAQGNRPEHRERLAAHHHRPYEVHWRRCRARSSTGGNGLHHPLRRYRAASAVWTLALFKDNHAPLQLYAHVRRAQPTSRSACTAPRNALKETLGSRGGTLY